MKLNRKVKFGATSGGVVGLITAFILGVLVKHHVSPEVLAFVPAAVAWAVHLAVSYLTNEVKPSRFSRDMRERGIV